MMKKARLLTTMDTKRISMNWFLLVPKEYPKARQQLVPWFPGSGVLVYMYLDGMESWRKLQDSSETFYLA